MRLMVAGQAGMPDRLEAAARVATSADTSDVFGQYGAAVSGASAVLLLFSILTIERLTGSEIRLQILYLIPVAIMTWSAGRAWGFALSIAAVAATFATYHANHVYPGDLLYYSEAGVTLATLSVFVLLTSRLRAALEAANRRVRELEAQRPG